MVWVKLFLGGYLWLKLLVLLGFVSVFGLRGSSFVLCNFLLILDFPSELTMIFTVSSFPAQ